MIDKKFNLSNQVNEQKKTNEEVNGLTNQRNNESVYLMNWLSQ